MGLLDHIIPPVGREWNRVALGRVAPSMLHAAGPAARTLRAWCAHALVLTVQLNYQALFTSYTNSKYFLLHPSHQIFKRMHGALNVGKKITNCIVCL
jgi:hypothetical protein